MRIRADIAELLHAGVPQVTICRQLRCAPVTVQRHREALGLPPPKSTRTLPATVEDAFRQYVRPTEDGHAEWTGPRNGGSPRVTHDEVAYSAYRVAFRIAKGREPEGRARPTCGRDGCVKPGHHADRAGRAEARKADQLYARIFGGAS